MIQHVRKSWSRLLILMVSVISGGTANAAAISIRQLGAQQLRLATIGYRLGAANAASCANPEMLTGLVVHDLTQYQPAVRAAISSAFSLHDGIGVLEVVPGSVADEAGFRIDDEVLNVDGSSIEDRAAVTSSARSYRRIELFSSVMERALRSGSADLLVRRNGQLLHVLLRSQPGCGGNTLLVNSSNLNAWSDGSHIVVSAAMMRLARNDDQLAFVVAHEMAHNLLGHSSGPQTRGLIGLFGLDAFKVRREEVDADAAAVPLMSAAGYAPFAAVEFLENARRILWWNASLDHPGFGQRIEIVGAAIARLHQPAIAPKMLASASPARSS